MRKQLCLMAGIGLGLLCGCQNKEQPLPQEKTVQFTKASTNANATLAVNDVFDLGSTWKYLDNGSNQGTAWRATAFNDATWSTGAGQFGFGESDQSTTLQSGFITYYFRRHFNVANAASLPPNLTLSLIHDDGAVVYVNGVEVLRSSLMPQTGTISYNTGTSTFIPNADENKVFTYQIPKSYFQTGDNVIAIEVHNQNTSSSDVSFDAGLSTAAPMVNNYDPDGPYVFLRNGVYVVKSIDRAQGYVSQTFASRGQVSLNVQLPNGDSFPVSLIPSLVTREQAEWSTLPSKFFLTSDIEGGIDGMVLLLKKAGVIDANYNWSYGANHLYVLGDMVDRGQYVAQCQWLLYKLEQEAAAAGGKVHYILGNHEIMVLTGDHRYVDDKYTTNAATMGETVATLFDGNSEVGKWLRSKNILERSGNTVFMHGGVSPEVAALNQSVTNLNTYVNQVINKTCASANCKTVSSSSYGLYWYRGMAQQALTQTQVNNILSGMGVDRAFIGHTILSNQITSLYQNKVVDIDVSHESNYTNSGYMEGVYYNGGCYFKAKATASGITYTPFIGSNCTP